MRGYIHRFPLVSVLFVEALLFLLLTRRGVYIPLSAAVACVFTVIVHAMRVILKEEERQEKYWTQVLDVQHWSESNRRTMQSTIVASIAFALAMTALAWASWRL